MVREASHKHKGSLCSARREFYIISMVDRENRKSKASLFPNREVIAKAEGRFIKADKQRAQIKADPKQAVARQREGVRRRAKTKR
jgi:hypothetical protein